MLKSNTLYACFAVVAFAAAVACAGPKPNILLVIGDDMTWYDCGAYGNKDVKTPNIDRLAGDGMKFTHMFTATAMCAPTRQQLYTGLFPVRNGAYPNHSRVHAGTKSMVHHLRALGYRVGIAGKTHFGPKESFPFETVAGRGIADKPQPWQQIKAFIERDRDQPFCLVIASSSPHMPWDKGDAAAYDPASFTLPTCLPDTPATRQQLARYYAEITCLDAQLGRAMGLVEQAGLADSTLTIFTSEQGIQMPRGKWTCYDQGLRTAFIVKWPGKVKAGSTTDAMTQYVDLVPTLIEAAGGEPASIDSGRPGAPDGGRGFDGRSFINVLQGQADRHRDLVFGVHTTRGIISGSESYPIRSVRDRRFKLILNLNHTARFTNIVTENDTNGLWADWKRAAAEGDELAAMLVKRYQHRPTIELYDLKTDPHELNDLADDPAQARVIARLQRELDRWMRQQGDQGDATERINRRGKPINKKLKASLRVETDK